MRTYTRIGFFTFNSNKNSDLSVFLSHYLPKALNFKWGIYLIVWRTFLSPVDSNKFNICRPPYHSCSQFTKLILKLMAAKILLQH